MSLGYLALEIRRVIRSPRFVIFTVGFPIVLLLFLSGAYGGTSQANAWVMISMTTWGTFSGALFTGARVATERGAGWQRQLRLTPLSGPGYLAAKMIVGMFVALPAVILVPLVGAVVDGVRLDATQWLHASLAVWLAAIPFALLGLLLGQFGTADSMQSMTGVVMMVLGLLGGVWIPMDSLPHWLGSISHLVPTYWMNQLGQGAIGPAESIGKCVLALGVWTVLLAGAVVRRYQRDSARV
jgi:ABC-2 type transport system permease protein